MATTLILVPQNSNKFKQHTYYWQQAWKVIKKQKKKNEKKKKWRKKE